MTDGLYGSQADWIALWREAMVAQGLTHREVDERAGLGEGYVSKLMCGLVNPRAPTIAKINSGARNPVSHQVRYPDALDGVAAALHLFDIRVNRRSNDEQTPSKLSAEAGSRRGDQTDGC